MLPLYAKAVVLLWLAFIPVFGFNHPHIEWQTVTTEHFSINYYDKTEPAVYAVWKIAEETYRELAPAFNVTFEGKIPISIAEYDDFSNGWAAYLDPSVMLWLPDARFDLRGNTVWLRNLISHELTHIFSLERKKGRQNIAFSLGAEYQYTGKDLQGTAAAQIPFPRMSMYPMWFVEGVAQRGAARMQADCRDSRREMVLRCAMRDNTLLSLDAMSHFVHDNLGNEMVYNQGFSFVDFLGKTHSDALVDKLCADGGTTNFNFAWELKARTGMSADQLYDLWKQDLARRYNRQLSADTTPVTPVFSRGKNSILPRVSAKGGWWGWIATPRDAGYRTELHIARFGSNQAQISIPWAHTAWCFAPDESCVYYVKSREANSEGSFLNDLFRLDLITGQEQRLTHNARVYDIAVAPDHSRLALVRYENGEFNLYTCTPGGTSMRIAARAPIGSPFMSPVFDPLAPGQLIATQISSGNADLCRIEIETGEVTPLVATTAQEESPWWGSDNRIYFSADYNGTFEVYSVNDQGADLQCHTSVHGGAFSPSTTPEGELLFSEYTSAGFRIVRARPAQLDFQITQSDESCRYRDLPRPTGIVRIKSTPYRPRLLRSVWEQFALIGVGQADTLTTSPALETSVLAAGGFMLSRQDALDKRQLALAVSAAVPIASLSSQSANSSAPVLPPARSSWSLDTLAPLHDRLHNPGSGARLRFYGLRNFEHTFAPVARASGESENSELPLLILQPGLFFRSSRSAATVGINAALLTVYGLPLAGQLSPFVTGRISRDWYWGVTPDISIHPLAPGSPVSGAIPLWFEWFTARSAHEDYGYNFRELYGVRFGGGAGSDKLMRITTDPYGFDFDALDTLYSDEVFAQVHAMAQGCIPVNRNASVVLFAQGEIKRYSESVFDPANSFHGESSVYAEWYGGSDFIFPLLRNINRGRVFASDLYGRVSYFHFHKTNDSWFTPGSTLWVDGIGAGVELGLTKNYMFSGRLSLSGYYAIQQNDLSRGFAGVELSLM